jgi:rod shape-determining protein MreC
VSPFDPVVSPEGLIGVVLSTAERTSIAMTWAHPEFRVSAFTVSGNAAGVVAPSLSAVSGEGALEFRGVPYRDSVPPGSLVLSSGLGGVYPKGIPVGTVTGLVREQAGWERVYRLLPAANPGSVGHVLILVAPPSADLASAFPSDSVLQAHKLDSLLRARRADSLAQAARDAAAARRDSVARAKRRVTRPDSGAPAPAPKPAPAPNPAPAAPPRDSARGDSAR